MQVSLVNYYEHHLGDWAKDVRGLSLTEEGAYRRLLDAYYSTEQPLPGTLDECCDLANTRTPADRKAVAKVLGKYFELAEDGYHQKRADAEIGRYQRKQRKAQDSANARWGKQRSQSDGNANAYAEAMRTHMPTHSERNAEAMHRAPVPSPQSPVTSLNTSDASHPHSSAADESLPGFEPETEDEDLPDGADDLPTCPHDKLIALYRKHLPELTAPLVWNGERQKAMRARWRQCSKPSAFSPGYRTEAEGLAFWEKFFEHVAKRTRLPRGFTRNGSTDHTWQPDLPWLVKAGNFAKVIEGAYSS